MPALASVGPCRSHRGSSSGGGKAAVTLPPPPALQFPVPEVYRGAPRNPDAFLNTLRYLFFHTRCGVAVQIRQGRVCTFAPFANTEYVNHYAHRMRLTHEDLSVAAYAEEKARSTRRPREAVLPSRRHWWLNGGIMCNVVPANVWGDEYFGALRDMLDETCAAYDVPDADFAINKRDYPQLHGTRNTDAYAAFTGCAVLPRERYAAYVPVFSFYTGSAMADLPMPTVEDWLAVSGRHYPPVWTRGFPTAPTPAPTPTTETHEDCTPRPSTRRVAKAVFRGTATGRGITAATNARLMLAEFGAARPDLVDAGVVAFNLRDRVVSVTPDAMTVDFLRPGHPDAPKLMPYMALDVQARTYEYVLYVDGHCAANRYGALMRSGMTILKVDSRHDDTCGRLWVFADLVSARVGASGTLSSDVADVSGADHFSVDADLTNLEATILYLRLHPEIATTVAANARKKAPTQASVLSHWAAWLQWVHAHATYCEDDSAASTMVFPPYEPRYARMARGLHGYSTTATPPLFVE